jgi:TolB protein
VPPAGDSEIVQVDLTGATTELTNDAFDDSSPVYAPDGSRIAYQSSRPASSLEIVTVNADGTGETLLTNDAFDDIDPSYSRTAPGSCSRASVRERRTRSSP